MHAQTHTHTHTQRALARTHTQRTHTHTRAHTHTHTARARARTHARTNTHTHTLLKKKKLKVYFQDLLWHQTISSPTVNSDKETTTITEHKHYNTHIVWTVPMPCVFSITCIEPKTPHCISAVNEFRVKMNIPKQWISKQIDNEKSCKIIKVVTRNRLEFKINGRLLNQTLANMLKRMINATFSNSTVRHARFRKLTPESRTLLSRKSGLLAASTILKLKGLFLRLLWLGWVGLVWFGLVWMGCFGLVGLVWFGLGCFVLV